jgi:hypothetical protein
MPVGAVRTTARVVTADAGKEGFGGFDRRRLRLGHLHGFARGCEARPPVVCREQPVVTDALEAGRQHVTQEAPDELGGWQRERAFAAGVIVSCSNSHLIGVTAEDSTTRRWPRCLAANLSPH